MLVFPAKQRLGLNSPPLVRRVMMKRYNERKEQNLLVRSVPEDFTDEIIDLFHAIQKEKASFTDLGIGFEEKAFCPSNMILSTRKTNCCIWPKRSQALSMTRPDTPTGADATTSKPSSRRI